MMWGGKFSDKETLLCKLTLHKWHYTSWDERICLRCGLLMQIDALGEWVWRKVIANPLHYVTNQADTPMSAKEEDE